MNQKRLEIESIRYSKFLEWKHKFIKIKIDPRNYTGLKKFPSIFKNTENKHLQ